MFGSPNYSQGHTGEVISEAYVLEYGTDCLEMHVGAVHPGERVLVIDDLVATGGTLCAAIRLLGMLMKVLIWGRTFLYGMQFAEPLPPPSSAKDSWMSECLLYIIYYNITIVI